MDVLNPLEFGDKLRKLALTQPRKEALAVLLSSKLCHNLEEAFLHGIQKALESKDLRTRKGHSLPPIIHEGFPGLREPGCHDLGHHLGIGPDLELCMWIESEIQEVEQVAEVDLPDPLCVQGGRKSCASQFAGQAVILEQRLVDLVILLLPSAKKVHDSGPILGTQGIRDKISALLVVLGLERDVFQGGKVELVLGLCVAERLLIHAGGSCPDPLTGHEDGHLAAELGLAHLEGGLVEVAHQVPKEIPILLDLLRTCPVADPCCLDHIAVIPHIVDELEEAQIVDGEDSPEIRVGTGAGRTNKGFGGCEHAWPIQPNLEKTCMLRTRLISYKIRLASLLGREVETMSKMFRLQFFADHVKIWELVNAGKRGQKVVMFVVTPSLVGIELEPEDREAIMKIAEGSRGTNDLLDALEEQGYRAEMRSVPAVKVQPSFGVPITLEAKGFKIHASPFKFEIVTPPGIQNRGQDRDPIVIDNPVVRSKTPGDAKKFYAWVLDNVVDIHEMSRESLFAHMRLQGINYV